MHRSSLIYLWAAATLALSAGAQTVVDPSLTVTAVLAPGALAGPTQLRFIAPNDFLVTEKDTGRVRRVQGGTLLPTPVLDLAVANGNERGLLGIALDPEFATNRFVYLYYTPSTGGDGGTWLENRVSRFFWNGSTLGSESVLAVFASDDDGQSPNTIHNGGPIAFGPDDRLYGTTGDLGRDLAEQNNQSQAGASSLMGGLYRLEANGSVPGTNPFVSSPNPDFHPWYGYGIRNSYGLTFDPVTGNLWMTENGPGSYDEINLVTAGFNSGWNEIMGPDSRDAQGVADLVHLAGSAYSDPEFSFESPIGITGLAFLAGSSLGPSYADALLVGDNNNGQIYLFRLDANRTGFVLGGNLADLVADSGERDQLVFGQDFGAVTDIQVGPDGAVYVNSISRGTVYRVLPEPSALAMTLAGSLAIALAHWRKTK